MQDNLQKELDHLARVLKQNGYLQTLSATVWVPPTQETTDTSSLDGQEQEKG